jgi:hypothetical protein
LPEAKTKASSPAPAWSFRAAIFLTTLGASGTRRIDFFVLTSSTRSPSRVHWPLIFQTPGIEKPVALPVNVEVFPTEQAIRQSQLERQYQRDNVPDAKDPGAKAQPVVRPKRPENAGPAPLPKERPGLVRTEADFVDVNTGPDLTSQQVELIDRKQAKANGVLPDSPEEQEALEYLDDRRAWERQQEQEQRGDVWVEQLFPFDGSRYITHRRPKRQRRPEYQRARTGGAIHEEARAILTKPERHSVRVIERPPTWKERQANPDLMPEEE